MRSTVIVIGAGHAGLAVSRRLTERSIDHVVIERGEVANSWRTERWNSLKLLTPNWQLDLPGMKYQDGDPDGYLSAADVTALVDRYAATVAAPVRTGTTVTRLTATGDGYEVTTDRGQWRCAAVVIASGACARAALPPTAGSVPPGVAVHTPMTYRSPDDLDPGGVLVVGASATGVQLAEEIHRSGRPVTLSVGEHVRMPRIYRGRDIFWWTDRAGILDERYDEVDDIVRVRHLPSPQLIGTPERRSIDINSLARQGVRIVGRLGRIVDGVAQFSGSLANLCLLADLKMARLLDTLDQWATATGCDGDVGPPQRFAPTAVAERPLLELDLERTGVATILFATGYRPDHSWVDLPVFDARGRIDHDGGAVRGAPGVYLVGHNMLRRRRSSFISGADADSDEICSLLHRQLAARTLATASGAAVSASLAPSKNSMVVAVTINHQSAVVLETGLGTPAQPPRNPRISSKTPDLLRRTLIAMTAGTTLEDTDAASAPDYAATATSAGFGQFRRVAETPLNIVFEAKP